MGYILILSIFTVNFFYFCRRTQEFSVSPGDWLVLLEWCSCLKEVTAGWLLGENATGVKADAPCCRACEKCARAEGVGGTGPDHGNATDDDDDDDDKDVGSLGAAPLPLLLLLLLPPPLLLPLLPLVAVCVFWFSRSLRSRARLFWNQIFTCNK